MPSTQQFLQFDHIRDDVIVLKGGDLRAILRVSSTNFGLKSQEEQDAIIYSFENFLNSLDFDLQILIHSQRMNIEPYLEDLKVRAEQQENELLRMQTEEYIEFIRSFVSTTNIMAKEFYAVVPFALVQAKKKSGALALISSFAPKRGPAVHFTATQFVAARTQLMQRVEFVSQNLAQIGLTASLLSTEEIIELLWRLYNPEQQETGRLPEIPAEALTNA